VAVIAATGGVLVVAALAEVAGLARGKFEMSKPLLSFLVFIALTFVTACDRARERTNVVTGDGQPEVTVGTTNIPEGFPIMWPKAATRTFGNGEARRSTYVRSIATFGQMGRSPISLTLRFSAIPTRPTATLLTILPM